MLPMPQYILYYKIKKVFFFKLKHTYCTKQPYTVPSLHIRKKSSPSRQLDVLFILFFRPTLVGEELYTQQVFFVQTIFADEYIHRRGLWVVSLESLSSVECRSKKIFFWFSFLKRITMVKKFEKSGPKSVYSHFHYFWQKFSSILLNFVKNVNYNVTDFN